MYIYIFVYTMCIYIYMCVVTVANSSEISRHRSDKTHHLTAVTWNQACGFYCLPLGAFGLRVWGS